MRNILIAGMVFLAAGTASYFFLQEKENWFNDPSLAAIYEVVSPPNPYATTTQLVIKQHGVYIFYVSYKNNGFNPKDFKIPVGNSARFVNNSNKALRVYSANQATPYHALNQPSSMGKGGIYNFNFTTKGFWEFYNLNNLNDKGSITVY